MSTSASSIPSPEGKKDHKPLLNAVHGFCKVLYQIGSPEVRAATFVFEHTICNLEYETPKRITLDEFVHGRKKVDGSRFTTGCGISKRNNVTRALKNLEDQGVLTVDTDERDKARQRKFYRLTLPSLTPPVIETDNRAEQDTVILPANVIHFDNSKDQYTDLPVIQSDNPVLSNPITQCYPIRELDQRECFKTIPQENKDVPTSSVQSTLLEQEDDAKMLELDRLKRDLANAKKWGGTTARQRDLERQIRTLQAQMQAEKEARTTPSHSQAPASAPAPESSQRAGLYESEQAQPQQPTRLPPFDLPEWTIADWKRDLESAERALERFESMPADMEPEKVAFRIESIKQKIANTKRTIAEMESGIPPPAPEPEPEQPKESMFTAVAHALGYPDTQKLNESARTTIGKAKREFEQVGIPVEQVGAVVSRYKRENRNFNIWAFLSELPKFAPMGGA